jgi:hypothetical protein
MVGPMKVEPAAILGALIRGPLAPRDLWDRLGLLTNGRTRPSAASGRSFSHAVADLREAMVPLFWDPAARDGKGLWLLATDRDTAHRYGRWVAARELSYAKATYRALRATDADPERLRLWRLAVLAMARAEGQDVRQVGRALDAGPGHLRELYEMIRDALEASNGNGSTP